MRILLISDSYPPVLGGSEIEAQRVSAALIRAGHAVHVLCSGGPPMPPVREWRDSEGVPVTILTRRSRGRRKDIAFALRVAAHIWKKRRNYDVVYFLMQGLHVAAGLPAARLAGLPIVMKISGDGIVSLMSRSRAGRLELEWLRQWRVPLMLLNESMFQEALAHRFPREQLVWMPNPVDIDQFRPAASDEALAWRARHEIPADARVVVYVGRLSHEKGIIELMRGFMVAARLDPQSFFLIVGDGPQRSELEKMAGAFDTSGRIRFTGRVDVSEVPFWLASSDVFALTSANEGFSCSLVEAMSAGLPSVVSNIPANLQLVDDAVHGLTVGWNDETAIGNSLFRLFGDRELRRRMGESARHRVVENYSTIRIVERYEALFSEAVSRGKASSQ